MWFDYYVSYWAWFGTIQLLLLTYQDYKNNMMVDDRKNFFMMGITISLLTHVRLEIWYVFACLFGIIFYLNRIKKWKAFGEGDINGFMWIYLGFLFINPVFFAIFNVIIFVFGGLYLLIKVKVHKITAPAPFFPIILISFVLTNVLIGLY